MVYFVTPTELLAAPVPSKTYRLGGLVMPGSLKWEPKSLDLSFILSDGKSSVPVKHKGAPPISSRKAAARWWRRVDARRLLQGPRSSSPSTPRSTRLRTTAPIPARELMKSLRGEGR